MRGPPRRKYRPASRLGGYGLLAVAIACASPAPAQEDGTPDERYRRGKSLFEFGDCAPAIAALAPLAVPGKLQDDRSQLDVHLMLGVCYVLANNELAATREFSSLLAIDPDFTLDPFLVPPPVIEVYDRQKTAMKEQLAEIKKAREKARDSGLDPVGGVLLESTTTIRDVPLAAAFMPLGLAQSANGENVKAIVVGSVQGAFLVANVGMFWGSFLTLEGKDPSVVFRDPAKKTAYQNFIWGGVIAALGFSAAYGAGVADALWNREDGAVVSKSQTRRALTPKEIKELKKIAPAPAEGSTRVTAPES
jgi:hypothetical protein